MLQKCIKIEPNTPDVFVPMDDEDVNVCNVVGNTVSAVVAAVIVDLGNDVDSTVKQSITMLVIFIVKMAFSKAHTILSKNVKTNTDNKNCIVYTVSLLYANTWLTLSSRYST